MPFTIKNWNIEELTGYHPLTTFYTDFSIADAFGVKAIKDTYERVVKEWLSDYKYFTEFVMVLNWKSWEHAQSDGVLAELYNDLWEKADILAQDNFTGAELQYFYETTD